MELPQADRICVHQIVVAHNVADRCAAHFGSSNSGTLIFNSDLRGADHYGDLSSCCPFEVGWLDHGRRFVHVLDDASLDILLTTRDTITDFIDYLKAKEELLHLFKDHGVRFCYTGEEELLANYLLTLEGNGHGFSFPDGYNAIAIPEGDWAWFQSSPQRAAQTAADRISYAWDALIEKFNANVLGGTSFHTTNPRVADRERLLRFLAREPRVRRRLLSESFIDMLRRTGASQRATRIMFPSNPGDPYYCFLLLPKRSGQTDDDYRKVRRELLLMLCAITKIVCPEALDIVGIATETGIETEPRSEDAVSLDARHWTEEMDAEARRAQQTTGLLTNLTKFKDKVAEFPMTRTE